MYNIEVSLVSQQLTFVIKKFLVIVSGVVCWYSDKDRHGYKQIPMWQDCGSF